MPFSIQENPEDHSITLSSKHLGGTGVRLPAAGTVCARMSEQAINVAHHLENEVGKLTNDAGLTQEGRHERIGLAHNELIAELDRQEASLATMVSDRRRQIAFLSEPGVAADAESAANDREARQAYAGLNQPQREALDAQMLAGEHPHVLTALMRGPIIGALPPGVHAIWKTRIEATHGEALRKLETGGEDESRAMSVVAGLRRILAKRPFGKE